jgi:hypothetical protein
MDSKSSSKKRRVSASFSSVETENPRRNFANPTGNPTTERGTGVQNPLETPIPQATESAAFLWT